jgi:hypothetical protein
MAHRGTFARNDGQVSPIRGIYIVFIYALFSPDLLSYSVIPMIVLLNKLVLRGRNIPSLSSFLSGRSVLGSS